MYVGWFICVISVYNPGSTSYRCHVNSNITLSQRVIGLFVSTEETVRVTTVRALTGDEENVCVTWFPVLPPLLWQ